MFLLVIGSPLLLHRLRLLRLFPRLPKVYSKSEVILLKHINCDVTKIQPFKIGRTTERIDCDALRNVSIPVRAAELSALALLALR